MLKRDVNQADIELTPISIVSVQPVIHLNELDQSFMYSRLLKEILLKMKYDENQKTKFIELCLTQQVENESAHRVIDEFERDYDGSSPIWWYTRDCFIYSMLNKALRTQDIEIIIKMSFFIRDLHQQIEQLHLRSDNRNRSIEVYRGQAMSNAEFDKMKNNKNGLLSFNSFLSTSFDSQIAFARADSTRDDPELTGVFFKIKIDPLISTTPFASIDDVSYFSDSEQEVLFSMHTIFRIGEMRQIENRLWEVILTLTSDDDEQLKRLGDYIHKEIEVQTEWAQLANLMLKMGEFKKSKEIYHAIHESAAINDLATEAWYHNNIGYIMTEEGNQKAALSHLQKALEIKEQYLPSDHLKYFIQAAIPTDKS
ncbi:unnamed protein product [Rotaria sordida]|uniref:Tetratricopeptide repeat protein n=1 Tax=Rotaria sordida TaxID=392033 RepID=A0A818T6L4_9BILA|nr:unnamed protein product [Rotaria sordida]CAF3678585.1 unnamed protein product [Rotaria sordida]